MQMLAIEDLRMISSNMANGNAIFKVNNFRYSAEFVFYLQGNDCVGIRLGRHDKRMETKALEEYLNAHKMEIRRQIKPEISSLKNENIQIEYIVHSKSA